MHHTDTVRIATNPRKWRRPAPCPACRKSRPLILTLGTIYNLRTRKPVNTIYGCICPNCRHKCILHVDGKNLNKAIRLWNHHAIAATGTTCSKRSGDGIKECIVTLSDTRKVDCVVYSNGNQAGLSCDWSHVSGADKEPQ